MFQDISRFSFPTSVVFGSGAVADLPVRLEALGLKKPLLVTDPGLKNSEVMKRVTSVLEQAGVAFAVFAEVHPNPMEDDVEKAAAAYRAEGCDGVIGLGGGSPLDVAKVITVRVSHEGPLSDYEAQTGGWERIKGPLPPMIAIPTTAGTGSEVGRSGVITVPSLGRKIVIFSPLLMPKFAIADPDLTVGLPPHLTAATGMDAFTHCLESLTSPVFHPFSDAIAVGGLELVVKYLERATRKGTDIEARGYMMIAAMMGAIAFQKDLGAAHSLAHPLSTEFGVHHGLANAICLPAVMRFNRDAAAAHYARVAEIFAVNGISEVSSHDPDAAAEAVAALNERLGITKRLRDCGVPEDALPALAKKAFADSCHATNPRPCTEADLLQLYRECW